jgi:1-acyl-sn-glycerol-3-phosphate acyltransferase
MSDRSEPAGAMRGQEPAGIVLDIVQRLVGELHPGGPPARVTLDSLLDRELGFDSLGRVELIARLERAFEASLPEAVLVAAETPRDLVRALQAGAHRAPTPRPFPAPPATVGAADAAPADVDNLLAVLDWHVHAHAQRPHVYLVTETGEEEILSYGALAEGAAAVAAGLRARELQPGQAVAIMLPTSREYFFCFYGVLRAGGIPVPIYPPTRASQIEEHLRRHARILANAQATALITVAAAKPVARLLRLQVEGLHTVVTAQELAETPAPSAAHAPQAQDIAMLQYTSGSTGNPKGVILTHANLLANIRAMGDASQAGSGDVFVSWMPLYHDMGLIGAWLGSLLYAIPLVVMSPLTFLAHPERWLWAIHRHRATLSGSPNFGYELCLRRIQDRDIEGLDLSSWRMAFNGAEPVSPDTITRFTERFARHGFRPTTMAPVYGLAESAVGLAFPPPGRTPVIDRIQRQPFMSQGRALPADAGDPHALRFVACGRPLPGHQIRIVDDTGHEVGEREEGRLEFQGPSATSGYFRNPEETRKLFHDGWLDSGDLAYTVGADVVITGRVKDVIIRAGRNIYPHELEEAVGNIPGVRKGCVAVFGSADPASASEKVVVLAETRETDAATHTRLRDAIGAAAIDLIGAAPDAVVLAPPHSVLKTSSGKVRRAASRELYERGRLGAPTRSLWRQRLRLLWVSARPQVRRALRALATLLYAVYAWIVFWTLAPLVWGLTALLPRRPAWNWTISRAAARFGLWLAGMPLRVQGLGNLSAGACVLVANHASYLDGIVLVAALPRHFSFVAKGELLARLVPRVYLKRLGAHFVERIDVARGVEDARQLARAARHGARLAFFPEGTFDRMPGLLPFRLGAFVAAAEAGVPVVPVAIRGTRSILRPDHWFPRRGTVSVTIGAPILPEGTDWPAAVRLRDATRVEIRKHCGEPDRVSTPQPP